MFHSQGRNDNWGKIIGFPQSGTRVEWVSKGDRMVQRGFYPSQVGRRRRRNDPSWIHPGTGFLGTVLYP